jgi:hypothetical protein
MRLVNVEIDGQMPLYINPDHVWEIGICAKRTRIRLNIGAKFYSLMTCLPIEEAVRRLTGDDGIPPLPPRPVPRLIKDGGDDPTRQ